MTNQRVAILDASHSLFKPSNVRIDGASKKDKDGPLPSTSTSLPSTTTSSMALSTPVPTSTNSPINTVFLQPIPNFATITKEVVAEGTNTLTRDHPKNLVDLNHGLICDTATVGAIMQNVHRKVVENLKAVNRG